MRRSITVDVRARAARGIKEGFRVNMASAADPALRGERERKGVLEARAEQEIG